MQKIRDLNWLIPVLLLVMMAVAVWLSPEERTLGTRIRIVYVHVAFVWAGLAGILITAILSLSVFLQIRDQRIEKLLPILSFVSVVCFAIGFLLSLAAAQINWGGIFWSEPRLTASLRVLSLAVIVQILAVWFPNLRFRAVLYIALLLFAVPTTMAARNAIHPSNAIFSSDSNSFAIATLTLMSLVILLALWVINWRYQLQH